MLKQTSLKHVKEEIRVLGIVISEYNNDFKIFGVIFRGKKYLEGVIQIKTNKSKLEESIIQAINNTPHKKQIRVILLHYKTLPINIHLDIAQIYNETDIPVIYILKEIDSLLKIDWKKNEDFLSIQFYGIKKQVVQKILKNVIQKENIPEVLRVAYLILESNLVKIA